MKTRCLIAIVVLLLCSASVWAESVGLGRPSKVAAAITLHRASPSSIMWGLGLFSLNDLESGNTSMWRREKQPSGASSNGPVLPTIDPPRVSSPEAPSGSSANLPGIDLVVPYDGERVLVVYGSRTAVEKLKVAVASMDVVHKQVQVKAEVVSVRPDKEGRLEVDRVLGTVPGKEQVDKLRQALHDGGAQSISSPILSTVDNQAAMISVSTDSRTTQLCALPRVNTDGSISLTMNLSFTESDPERKQALFTTRRLRDGETMVMGGFIYSSDAQRMLLLLLTPKVVD